MPRVVDPTSKGYAVEGRNGAPDRVLPESGGKRSLVRLLGEMGYDVRSIRREKGTLLATVRR